MNFSFPYDLSGWNSIAFLVSYSKVVQLFEVFVGVWTNKIEIEEKTGVNTHWLLWLDFPKF